MRQNIILLVEDDADIQENLQLFLEGEGYLVHAAHNGQEAMDYLKSNPAPKVILLDLMMPVMNGYEVLEKLETEAIPKNSIVLLSAATDLQKTANQHAVKFVRKPIDLDKLTQTIGSMS